MLQPAAENWDFSTTWSFIRLCTFHAGSLILSNIPFRRICALSLSSSFSRGDWASGPIKDFGSRQVLTDTVRMRSSLLQFVHHGKDRHSMRAVRISNLQFKLICS